jgi:hypothetical protein
VDRWVSRGQRGGSPTAVNVSFIDRSRYFFFQVAAYLSSWGWVDPVPDPLLRGKNWQCWESNSELLGLQPGTLTTKPYKWSNCLRISRINCNVKVYRSKAEATDFRIFRWNIAYRSECLPILLFLLHVQPRNETADQFIIRRSQWPQAVLQRKLRVMYRRWEDKTGVWSAANIRTLLCNPYVDAG